MYKISIKMVGQRYNHVGRRHNHVMDLFESKDVVRICAPMVRYSKQPFRQLVRRYNCDLTYTPMIIADSFLKSNESRNADYTTSEEDEPVIMQFAANNASDLANVAELVQPYCDGIGLNCGCPQKWAMAEGYGCDLLKRPELLKDMVQQTRQRVGNDFPIEVKIRINKDLRQTISLCQQAEHAGISWLSVHGRSVTQRREPVDYEAIRTIKDSLSVPVVANGDIKSEDDVIKVKLMTNVDGVMAAQGMLNNPAMYSGYSITPECCIKDWLNISVKLGTPFVAFHQHLIFMLEKWHTKGERHLFNNLSSAAAVFDFLEEHYDITYDDVK